MFFFFQAEDGIRDLTVTGVQTCALPILSPPRDGAGDLRQLPQRAAVVAPEDPVRDRADRQGVPQRDHARELYLSDARVRADGDAVLREAGDRGEMIRVLAGGAPEMAPPPTHPAGAAAVAPNR